MISTSSYKDYNSKYNAVSISGNRGKDAGYSGNCYPALAPKLSFWKIWHDNIGKISAEENNKYYIEEYYKQVLSKMDPEEVYTELIDSVLLCYENNMEFCHRHIVAAWFELFLDIIVPEIKTNGNKISRVERPEYIKEYLYNIIKENNKMYGFKSLRAVYLFEKSEVLEEKAELIKEEDYSKYEEYMTISCYYRCAADNAEDKYIFNENQKKLIKK